MYQMYIRKARARARAVARGGGAMVVRLAGQMAAIMVVVAMVAWGGSVCMRRPFICPSVII